MARYVITAVHYTYDQTHIDSAAVRPLDAFGQMGIEQVYPRNAIVNAIDAGHIFFTLFVNQFGQYQLGAQVGVISVGWEKFLKTHSDGTTRDNLDTLPRF